MQPAPSPSPTFSEFRREGLAFTRAAKHKDDPQETGAEQWQEVVHDGPGFLVRSTAGASASEKPASDRWDQHTWRAAFEQMFVANAMDGLVHRENADDMLFFIRRASHQDKAAGRGPMFVRRKGKQGLPPDCRPGGSECEGVDWARSTLLNTVLQTPFYLTVSTCDKDDLSRVLQFSGKQAGDAGGCSTGGNGGDQQLHQVTKHVFASPTKVHVNLDSSRGAGAAPVVTYPNICFAVDNFDEAFDSMLLSQRDECYSVCLWARRLTDAPARPPSSSSSSEGASAASEEGEEGGEEGTGAVQPPLHTAQHAAVRADPSAIAAATDVDTLTEALGGASISDSALECAGAAVPDSGPAAAVRTSADAHPLMPSSGGSALPRSLPQTPGSAAGAAADPANGAAAGAAAAAAAATAAGKDVSSGDSSAGQADSGDHLHLLLFSGYVSFQQLEAVVDTTGVHPLQLWMKPSGGSTTHKVIMKGPGGVGHADVAVTVCAAPTAGADEGSLQHTEVEGGSPPGVQLRKRLFGSAVKLAGAAAKAARDIASGTSSDRREGLGPLPVRCALMTLVLPVDEVARRVLKGS